jgi:hypothetical protein
MKTPLSLGLMIAAACALPACSSDEGEERPVGGAGATATAGSAGAPSGGTGGAPAAGGGGAGGTGGAPASAYTAGPALVITPTATGANVIDEDGDSGISGGVILAQSTMATPAVTAHEDGRLCWSGETATVLNMDYGTYWGAELALDLLLEEDPNAPPPAADAGADAGGGGTLVRQPWPIPPGLVGFSFEIEANGATGVVPVGREDIRFKALPAGSDPALDTFCNQVNDPVALTNPVEVPLSEITWECWAAGNPSVAEPQLNTVPTPGATLTTRTNPNALLSISWQVSANITANTPFNFCISEIKPLYEQ